MAGWVLMDLNNSFKCRIGGEDLSNVQFQPKLWNLRPIIKVTTDAVKIPAWPETYAQVEENQDTRLAGSFPLPSRSPQYPRIRRKLLGVNSPLQAPRIETGQVVKEGRLKWSEGWSRTSSVRMPQLNISSNSPFWTCGVGRRSRPYHQENQGSPQATGKTCTLPPAINPG